MGLRIVNVRSIVPRGWRWRLLLLRMWWVRRHWSPEMREAEREMREEMDAAFLFGVNRGAR